MADPYDTLGVRRGDSAETIRTAYRKLAKRWHPDLNPGNAEAAARFTAINGAYELLSDADKRARFDRGEIDADGRETAPPPPPPGAGRSWSDFASREGYGRRGFSFDPSDLDELFGRAGGGSAGGFADLFGDGGNDVHYTLSVSFLEAANGAQRRVTLPDGRVLDVTIPAGIGDGHVLRLKGQGSRGRGGAPGDALVEISVAPHRLFRREGFDVVIDLPVSLREAVLGASIEVPTVRGRVRLAVPPGSGEGTRLRLKGQGIAGGNQYVVLHPVVPPGNEPALAEFLRNWAPETQFDPRAGLADAGRDST